MKKNALMLNGKWLNDLHINAAQQLLKKSVQQIIMEDFSQH